MRNYTAKTVDSYIANSAPESQAKQSELRVLIKSTIPEAEESIKWGVPFYMYHGMLAGFSVFKSHITFGLAFVFDEDIREKLEGKGYSTGKKTVQIKFNQKLPVAEIRKLLKDKARENETRRFKTPPLPSQNLK